MVLFVPLRPTARPFTHSVHRLGHSPITPSVSMSPHRPGPDRPPPPQSLPFTRTQDSPLCHLQASHPRPSHRIPPHDSGCKACVGHVSAWSARGCRDEFDSALARPTALSVLGDSLEGRVRLGPRPTPVLGGASSLSPSEFFCPASPPAEHDNSTIHRCPVSPLPRPARPWHLPFAPATYILRSGVCVSHPLCASVEDPELCPCVSSVFV